MAVVLDSDVVIGFLDRGDALHTAADAEIREQLRSQRLLVSAVTYAEVLTGARLGHHQETQVRAFFEDLISEIVVVDQAVADTAAELRSRHRALRMPDALILATAETNAEAGLLVTADAQIAKVPGVDCDVRLLR